MGIYMDYIGFSWNTIRKHTFFTSTLGYGRVFVLGFAATESKIYSHEIP